MGKDKVNPEKKKRKTGVELIYATIDKVFKERVEKSVFDAELDKIKKSLETLQNSMKPKEKPLDKRKKPRFDKIMQYYTLEELKELFEKQNNPAGQAEQGKKD